MSDNPTCDLEAERICLGAAIGSQSALDMIRDKLTLESFDYGRHRDIWLALEVLWRADHKPSAIDVIEQLQAAECKFMDQLPDYVYAIEDEGRGTRLAVYIERIQTAYRLRRLALLARDITNGVKSGEAVLTIEEAAKELGEISCLSTEEPQLLEDVLMGKDHLIDEFRQHKKDKDSGITVMAGPPSGFAEIDEHMGGLGPSRFLIVAARAGMGKTEILSHMIASNARNKVPALVFSMEMSRKEYAARISGPLIRIHGNRALRGTVTDEEAYRYSELERLARKEVNGNILIDARAALSTTQIKAVVRRYKEKYGIQVVYIDHMGLIRDTGKTPYEKASNISRDLKELAMGLDVCVVAACQINRAGAEGYPKMWNLRDSGNIEQDVDQAILFHREEIHGDNVWRVELAKNRHGEETVVKYLYDYRSATVSPYVDRTVEIKEECDRYGAFVPR